MAVAHDLLIGDQWQAGTAAPFSSHDPATGDLIWEGREAAPEQVDAAIAAAAAAFPDWAHAPIQGRIDALLRFGVVVKSRSEALAITISQEVGKPLWEARAEVAAVLNKIPITIEAYRERACERLIESSATTKIATRYRPHGVVGVLGPFNLPAHIPHGQIIPALLAGNTVVYKPSELAPLVAEQLLDCWEEADLPAGVLNLVQGGCEVGKTLATHPMVRALFFTGSAHTGSQLAACSDKLVALEMGGNNPLVIAEVEDVQAAAYVTVESAFLTTGQRCSCARRLILPAGAEGDELLAAILSLTEQLIIGSYTTTPEPFIGPLISTKVAHQMVTTQSELVRRGAVPLCKLRILGRRSAFVTPGILDVTPVADRPDEEYFGPLLQVVRVTNFHAAIEEANRTSYGLTAGLLSDNRALYQHFLSGVRAGLINWNAPLTGASSYAPFGGVGKSGNYHPAGYFAVDDCTYPVASTERSELSLPDQLKPGIPL